MTPARQGAYWAIVLAVLIALLMLLSDVLLPFVAGLAIAYFLDPIVDKLEAKWFSRTLATLLVLLLFFLAVTAVALMLVPVLYDQVVGFAERFPGYVSRGREIILPWLAALGDQLGLDLAGDAKLAMAGFSKTALAFFADILTQLWSSGLAILNLVSLLVISPIVAFYMLRDWDRITAKVDSWLPRHLEPQINELVVEIDQVLGGFVRGQGTVCLILGTFYGVALTVAGLEFGLIIGIVSGLISFIPFVGAIFGLILSMLTAFTQFWPELTPIAIVAAIFIVGQFLEGNFLTPRLLGDKVGLHPVWVIFSLLAFGSMFGFLGVLLAIPVAAVIGVLVRFLLNQYIASPLYLGPDGVDTAASDTAGDALSDADRQGE